jgi:hypothetical protein
MRIDFRISKGEPGNGRATKKSASRGRQSPHSPVNRRDADMKLPG